MHMHMHTNNIMVSNGIVIVQTVVFLKMTGILSQEEFLLLRFMLLLNSIKNSVLSML